MTKVMYWRKFGYSVSERWLPFLTPQIPNTLRFLMTFPLASKPGSQRPSKSHYPDSWTIKNVAESRPFPKPLVVHSEDEQKPASKLFLFALANFFKHLIGFNYNARNCTFSSKVTPKQSYGLLWKNHVDVPASVTPRQRIHGSSWGQEQKQENWVPLLARVERTVVSRCSSFVFVFERFHVFSNLTSTRPTISTDHIALWTLSAESTLRMASLASKAF